MPKHVTTRLLSSKGHGQGLASRFPLSRIQSTTSAIQRESTLVLSYISPSTPSPEPESTLYIQQRKRTLSTASIETIRPVTKKPHAVLKKKRAREDDTGDATDLRLKTKQRTGSSATIRAPGPMVMAGYAAPAAPVLTVAQDPSRAPSPEFDFSDFEPITPPPSPKQCKVEIAPKSPDITRERVPRIPNKIEAATFPVMESGLREYHDRFRARELSRPRRDLSSNIIPDHLAPPQLVYEAEDAYPFDERDYHPVVDAVGNPLDIGSRYVDMAVVFKKTRPYFDMWDMVGVEYSSVPAKLYFVLKDDYPLHDRSLPPRPDLRCIDIKCQSFDYRRTTSKHSAERLPSEPEFVASYSGRVYSQRGQLKTDGAFADGIVIMDKWYKTCQSRTGKSPKLDPSDESISPAEDCEEEQQPQMLKDKKGWFLKVWLPVPVALFAAKESRAFQVDVQAWLGSEHSGGIVSATAEFMISHLRSRKELGILLPA